MNNLDPLRPSPPQPPSGGEASHRVPPTGPAPRRPAIRGRGGRKRRPHRLSFLYFSARGWPSGFFGGRGPGEECDSTPSGRRWSGKGESLFSHGGRTRQRGRRVSIKRTLTRTDLGSGVITRRT
jgi:hypothetical protein